MVKDKKRISFIIIILMSITVFVVAFMRLFNFDKGNSISIENQSDQNLENLNVYCNDKKIATIYLLESKKHIDINFDLPSDFIEGRITLQYSNGRNVQEKIIYGYVEKNSTIKIILKYTSDYKLIKE